MIPISKPWIDKEELEIVKNVLESGELTNSSFNGGKYVREFESMLRDYCKINYAIAVNSGTSALYASLLALGIGSGDEVIIPSLTFVATANVVAAVGAKPVFVDVKEDDYTMDPKDLEKKISKKTKAIIPVHIYGHTSDMDSIKEIADRYSLYIIEDACQSLGSMYKGKHTGTIGDLGCYSFYPSKVITAGEGGAIVTNDKDLADKLRMIRNHGMLEGYDTRILGLNLRMGELNASIAVVQMKKLERILAIRRRNASILSSILNGYVKIPIENEHSKYNWYLYTILVNNRDYIQRRLNELGIEAKVYYKIPVHKTPFYSESIDLPITDYIVEHVLSLPVHQAINENEVEYIGKSLISIINS